MSEINPLNQDTGRWSTNSSDSDDDNNKWPTTLHLLEQIINTTTEEEIMESYDETLLWDFTNQEEQQQQQQQGQQREGENKSTQEIVDMLCDIKGIDEEDEEKIVVDGFRVRSDLEDFMALDKQDMDNDNLEEGDAVWPLMPQFEDTPKGRSSQLMLDFKFFNSQPLIGDDPEMVNTPEVMRDIIELQQQFPGSVSWIKFNCLIEDSDFI